MGRAARETAIHGYTWADYGDPLLALLSKRSFCGHPSGNFAVRNDLVGRFVVLYAGHVSLAQGVETLVDATALATIPGILVLVVGAGAELGQVRAQADAQLYE